MQCSQCAATCPDDVPEGDAFCGECGHPLSSHLRSETGPQLAQASAGFLGVVLGSAVLAGIVALTVLPGNGAAEAGKSFLIMFVICVLVGFFGPSK